MSLARTKFLQQTSRAHELLATSARALPTAAAGSHALSPRTPRPRHVGRPLGDPGPRRRRASVRPRPDVAAGPAQGDGQAPRLLRRGLPRVRVVRRRGAARVRGRVGVGLCRHLLLHERHAHDRRLRRHADAAAGPAARHRVLRAGGRDGDRVVALHHRGLVRARPQPPAAHRPQPPPTRTAHPSPPGFSSARGSGS